MFLSTDEGRLCRDRKKVRQITTEISVLRGQLCLLETEREQLERSCREIVEKLNDRQRSHAPRR